MAEIIEIRWHGRGGQGVVTAGEILAGAALREGKYFQAFPDYGPERMGAPVRSFTRISDAPINIHSQIYYPQIVVVLDETLIGLVNFTEGLPPEGILVVNSELEPEALRKKISIDQQKVYTIDATRLALEILKRPITNTAMLGAMIRSKEIIKLENIIQEIRDRLQEKFGTDIVERNIQMVKWAYEEVKQG